MLLVYTPKITPRIGYIFRHIFFRMLNVEIGMTSSIEKFISHNGAKISYSDKPLGKELFFYRSKILIDTGIQDFSIQIFKWNNYPAFFKVPDISSIPFDIFGASFYLITRYEEYLPHINDSMGRFQHKNSIAFNNNFLEIPLVDIWVNELQKIIKKNFIDIIKKDNSKIKFLSILQVSEPYKFSNKSFFSSIFQGLKFISRLDFKSLFEQVLVLTKFKKDPFDEYDFIINFFQKNS